MKIGRSIPLPTKIFTVMYFTKMKTAAILAAAAGGPYVATETDMGRSAVSTVTGYATGQSGYVINDASYSPEADAGLGSHAHHQVETLRRGDPNRYRYDPVLAKKLGGGPTTGTSAPQLVGAPIQDIREVLRFDITPRWVIDRFARVSTVLSDLRLEGLRVPLVTGTRAEDFAGTLTYFFDRSDKLQRVTLHGFTGHPDPMVNLLMQHYGLTQTPSLEAGVYTKRWNGVPVHFLRLTHAPVVYSDAVHQKYTIFLELNQPNLAYGISHEARRVVDADRQSGRW